MSFAATKPSTPREPTMASSKFLAFFVVLGTTVACGGAKPVRPVVVVPAAPVKLTPAEIAKRADPSIVRIQTDRGLGTGFVVSDKGDIATNLHVIDGAHQIE